MSKPVLFVRTMNAIGDCILSRPFIRVMANANRLALQTPFPELFSDLGVERIVRAKSNVPYASKAIREWGEKHDWRGAPKDKDGNKQEPIYFCYDINDPANVTDQLRLRMTNFTRHHYKFDLPPDVALTPPTQKYAVIRPVVTRDEFPVTARNCDPRYIYKANEMLQAAGYTTFAVANVPDEDPAHPYPNVDFNLGRGQLTFIEMMTLIRNADIVVSGPGFAMPMAVAAEKPMLAAIWGARRKLDNHNRIFHHWMDKSRVRNFVPDTPCTHSTDECGCDKTISHFEQGMAKLIHDAQAR